MSIPEGFYDPPPPTDQPSEHQRLIAENNALVAEIEKIDMRIKGIGFTPKAWREQRLEEWRSERAAKLERHKKFVAEIRRQVPTAQAA